MRELLAGLVPGLPGSAVREPSSARADGIPLYAVETVRMLVGGGPAGRRRDGVYVPTGDLTALAVPETLTALIAARLDALDPADRALVQDAAVLGQTFTLGALAAVSGHRSAELSRACGAWSAGSCFRLRRDPRSPERGQYAFVQALIREVAYNTLARRDRKARHLAAARYFEASGPTSWPVRWPATTWPPTPTHRTAPRPMRWRPRHASRSWARRSGRRTWVPTTRPWPSCSRR